MAEKVTGRKQVALSIISAPFNRVILYFVFSYSVACFICQRIKLV